jgi:hypothetical protein
VHRREHLGAHGLSVLAGEDGVQVALTAGGAAASGEALECTGGGSGGGSGGVAGASHFIFLIAGVGCTKAQRPAAEGHA